jgi:hypothetical protein
MPDNVGYTPGSGATIAADEIGGALYQRVKPVVGADGVATDVSEANPMPVGAQALTVLQRIAALLKPLGQPTGGGSNRLSLDVNAVASLPTLGTVSTVTTVTTVSNVSASTLTNVANLWVFDQAKAMSRQAYNSGIRSRL